MDGLRKELLEIYQWFVLAEYGRANAALSRALDGVDLSNVSEDMGPVFQAIISAQERKDYIYLADLIKYEWAARLDK